MITCSERMAHVHSDIRGPLYEEALRMQAAGEKVLKLNTGNPGIFGFRMPESVRQALARHLEEAAPYCDLRGMRPAREAICTYHTGRGLKGLALEDIFICNGVSEAASLLMTALLSREDEVLMPAPCYSLWSNNAYLRGGKPVFYRCDPQRAWNPDLDDMARKITPRTKAFLIINPNNPTGAVYSRETLLAIAELARQNHLLLISDEIYDRLLLDNRPYDSLAALAPDLPCVTLNGLSKSHIVCGFRCGWMAFTGPRSETSELLAAVTQLASMRLCSNALMQLVIPAALHDPESTQAMLTPGGRLYEQRRATEEGLRGVPGVSFVENKAAFYLFPGISRAMYPFRDGYDFAMKFLHEEHVLVIPGEGFEWHEDLRFRIVMLPEPEELTRAMAAFRAFLARHRKAE